MARTPVPYDPEPQVLPHDEPAPNQRIEATPASFGGSIAQALSKGGQELERGASIAGGVALSQQQLYDETFANSAAVDITTKQTQEYEDLARRKGAAAMEHLPQYRENLEKNYKDAIDNAPNDRTRAMISKQARYVTDHWLGTGQHYGSGQQRVWEDKTSDDKRDSDASQALLAINNPPAMETFLRGSDDAVRKKYEDQFYDKKAVDQEVRKNRGRNYEKIIKTMVDDPDKGPVVAAEFFKQHASEMDAASAVSVSASLKVGLNTVAGREKADVVMNRGISGATEQIATQEGVDANRLKRIIKIESSGDPTATKGSYHGLGQLSQEEFKKHGGGNNIFDPEQNLRATARKLRSEELDFTAKYGRPPSDAEIYMIHQQGPAGAAAHMANPGGVAWQNIRPYYTDEAAHRKGFASGDAYARAAIWGNVPDDLKGRFGSVDNVTSGQFTGMWQAKLAGSGTSILPDKQVAFEQIVAATKNNPVQQNAALAWMNHVYSIYESNRNSQLATFQTKLQDSTAEALHTGSVKDPIPPEEFYEKLGFEKGEEALRTYQDQLQFGSDARSLKDMTDVAQNDLLAQREPPPGPGYFDRVKRYDKLKEAVSDNREERRSDPAGAVRDDNYVKNAQDLAKDGKQPSFNALVTARLAAQERLGIPKDEQSPITHNEAVTLTTPMTRMLPGEERAVLGKMQQQFQQLFGENAPQAWNYAMRVNKLNAEAGKAALNISKKLAQGIQPTREETHTVDTANDLGAAGLLTTGWYSDDTTKIGDKYFRIISGDMVEVAPPTDIKPPAAAAVPGKDENIPADAIKGLIANPKLADQFNQKYGAGGKDVAKDILKKYSVRPGNQ